MIMSLLTIDYYVQKESQILSKRNTDSFYFLKSHTAVPFPEVYLNASSHAFALACDFSLMEILNISSSIKFFSGGMQKLVQWIPLISLLVCNSLRGLLDGVSLLINLQIFVKLNYSNILKNYKYKYILFCKELIICRSLKYPFNFSVVKTFNRFLVISFRI